ncbi:hypothetical protein BKA69DRAFT_1043903 [Paraphysoderma sedebokerense]|nr:hypothetical protein BKA69DRAFT_1043903 [Paraphysoderma sedebokerense]
MRTICATTDYIAYGIRGSKIRILNRADGSKALLKPPGSPPVSNSFVNDVSFSPPITCSKYGQLLAAVENTVVVYKLKTRSDGVLESSILKVLDVTSTKSDVSFRHVIWSDDSPGILAVSMKVRNRGWCLLLDLEKLQGDENGVVSIPLQDCFSTPGILCWKAHVDIVNSITFLPSTSSLITASQDGSVKFWTYNWQNSTSSPIGAIIPSNSNPVTSVHLLFSNQSSYNLIIGTSRDTCIHLYTVSLLPEFSASLQQTLTLQNSDHPALVPSTYLLRDHSLLLMSCFDRMSIIVISFNHSQNSALFDFMVEFPLQSAPILNFMATANEHEVLEIHGVQPHIIQQFKFPIRWALLSKEAGVEYETVRSVHVEDITEIKTGHDVESMVPPPTSLKASPKDAELSGAQNEKGKKKVKMNEKGKEKAQEKKITILQRPIASVSETAEASGEASSPINSVKSKKSAPPTSATSPAVTSEQSVKLLSKHIDKRIENLYARLEQERLDRQAVETSRQETLLKVVSQTLSKNVASTLEGIVKKEIHDSVIPKLGNLLEATFASRVTDELSKTLPSTLDANIVRTLSRPGVIKSLSDSVSDSISLTIESMFRDTFGSNVIPSYQKATGVMFQQIAAAFEKGVGEVLDKMSSLDPKAKSTDKQSISQLQATVSSLSNQLSTLQESMGLLVKQNEQMMAMLRTSNPVPSLQSNAYPSASSATPSSGFPRRSSFTLPSPSTLDDVKREAEMLIRNENFEGAFTNILSSGNIENVIWIAQRVKPRQVFPPSGPLLTQPVILSLLHQLSLDCSRDIPTQMLWMQECVMVLNPKDPLIFDHCVKLLPSVSKRLQSFWQKLSAENPSSPFLKDIKMLLRVLHSLG